MTTLLAGPPNARKVKANGRAFWSGGYRVIEFVETCCLFSNGRWTGEPFVLLPWQRKLIHELFEVDSTGRRIYRRALIGLPRKAGKTELAAALSLYLLLADGERSAQIYCAAASEEQADMVFEAAKRMCELDGAPLADMVDVSVSRLTSKVDPYSFMQRLSSKGKTKHGLNIHGVILDELHAWGAGEGEELWAALNTGSAAREQPMQIAITTAGIELEWSRCGQMYQLGRAIEAGLQDGAGFFFRWWQAPEGMDYRDPDYPRLASPSYGHTVDEGFYRDELASVPESVFRRLYGNEWVDFAEAPWVSKEQLAAGRVGPFELRPGEPTWVGVDLSRSEDSTAVGQAQQWSDDARPCGHTGPEPCLYFEAHAWERPRRPDGKLELGWRVPLDDVRQHIRDLNAKYDVLTNVFDPYGSQLMLLDLEGEGLPCELLFQQGAKRSAAATGLYDLIIQGRFHYWQDEVERHVLNATVKTTGDDGYYLQKRRKGKVMDIAQAASHCVYGTLYTKAVGPGMGAFFA